MNHSPEECNNFVTSVPLKFSHKRYFVIQLRKFFLRGITNSPFISASSIADLCGIKVLTRLDFFKFKLFSRFYKSIYIKSELLETFLSRFSKSLKAQVIVIGSSDRNFNDFSFDFPRTVHTILCQNNASAKERLFTLPLGLENRELGRAGLKKFHKNRPVPVITNRVFVPPMSPTNPIRRKTILECFENPRVFDIQVQLLEEKDYFELAAKYRFVLCLEGNGFENHRIWETLYRGGLPILLRSNWSQSLCYLNLPIILIESVRELNEEFLIFKDREFAKFSPELTPVLWTPFWKSVISSKIHLDELVGNKFD